MPVWVGLMKLSSTWKELTDVIEKNNESTVKYITEQNKMLCPTKKSILWVSKFKCRKQILHYTEKVDLYA